MYLQLHRRHDAALLAVTSSTCKQKYIECYDMGTYGVHVCWVADMHWLWYIGTNTPLCSAHIKRTQDVLVPDR